MLYRRYSNRWVAGKTLEPEPFPLSKAETQGWKGVLPVEIIPLTCAINPLRLEGTIYLLFRMACVTGWEEARDIKNMAKRQPANMGKVDPGPMMFIKLVVSSASSDWLMWNPPPWAAGGLRLDRIWCLDRWGWACSRWAYLEHCKLNPSKLNIRPIKPPVVGLRELLGCGPERDQMGRAKLVVGRNLKIR